MCVRRKIVEQYKQRVEVAIFSRETQGRKIN